MITSFQNPMVKRVKALADRRDRQREGVFLIEGEKELLAAAKTGILFETILFCGEILSQNTTITDEAGLRDMIRQSGGAKTVFEPISDAVYAKLAYRESSGGMIGLAKMPNHTLGNIRLSKNPLILVLVGLEKPGNVGAILRTADAAGVDAVFVCDDVVDLYNPNVVRASLGALFTVQTMQVSTKELKDWLAQRKITIVAASPDAKLFYTQANMADPIAIVLGAEHEGLPAEWLSSPGQAVKIPMLGRMDSLNVASSAAILLYEAIRQRNAKGL